MRLQIYLSYLFFECVHYIKTFFNYYIRKVEFVYIRNGEKDTEDITVDYKVYGPKGIVSLKSEEVTEFLFKIQYLYNFKTYVYMTQNPEHAFPPWKPKPSFRIPVKEAFALDIDGVPLRNITKEIKAYEGPFVDFHGEDIVVKDIGDFTKVRLVNVMGQVSEFEGVITHQNLWLQGKT
jgi:hypothetical protein